MTEIIKYIIDPTQPFPGANIEQTGQAINTEFHCAINCASTNSIPILAAARACWTVFTTDTHNTLTIDGGGGDIGDMTIQVVCSTANGAGANSGLRLTGSFAGISDNEGSANTILIPAPGAVLLRPVQDYSDYESLHNGQNTNWAIIGTYTVVGT